MRTWWLVIPDEEEILPQWFVTKRDALDWDDGLPCGYTLEHV